MSPEKLLLIALIVALVFGAARVPTLARRAGKGIRETKEALGLDEIRGGIGDVRSTLTEPVKMLQAPEEPAEKEPGTQPPAS
jgi:TatA/E family protein of Tat protein translocase